MRSFDEARLPKDEQAQRATLTALVAAYEAVRLTPGRERDRAERALGLALASCLEPFVVGQWVYRWDWHEESITRRRAIRAHLPTRHREPAYGVETFRMSEV